MSKPVTTLALLAPGAALATAQSAVHPRGAGAGDIAFLWWILLGGAIAIFCAVLALVLYALLSRRPRTARDPRLFIVGGGLVFPAVVLGALLVYTVSVGARLAAPAPADSVRIDVTGYMWWWDVRYGGAGGDVLAGANELRIPVGRTVDLRLRSEDVIHSFWVPSLAGKVDMIPGRTNRLTLRADAPGTWRGQCAEFCGAQHAQMALHVVAMPADEWERWFAAQRTAAAAPVTPVALRGQRLFAEAGCVACHAIRGVSDPPRGLGPDLTHVGSRPSLAAGMLPNNRGTLAAWIAQAQAIKPGSRMPSFHNLDGESLTALSAYLSELE
jgi:cytochrome c oxidase subunit 2